MNILCISECIRKYNARVEKCQKYDILYNVNELLEDFID